MYWHGSYRGRRLPPRSGLWGVCAPGILDRAAGALLGGWRNSTMNNWADTLLDDVPIRHELVERVRREIAAGTYETPEKFEKALARLLERLSED